MHTQLAHDVCAVVRLVLQLSDIGVNLNEGRDLDLASVFGLHVKHDDIPNRLKKLIDVAALVLVDEADALLADDASRRIGQQRLRTVILSPRQDALQLAPLWSARRVVDAHFGLAEAVEAVLASLSDGHVLDADVVLVRRAWDGLVGVERSHGRPGAEVHLGGVRP
eukprot:scaffold2275_cov245-Pinguiococcus_pyrenoidosus.AAC.6